MVYDDVEQFCRKHFVMGLKRRFIYDRHKKYLRIGAGFDIETTRKDTYAYMYHWQFSFGDDDLLCRTWYSFHLFMKRLQYYLTCINARLIVWVANLGHEFAFIGRRFHWEKVFARESHQPIVAQTERVEFRECLTISGQGGLKNLAKKYTKTQKLTGDLDYTKMRNSRTPLTDTEKSYCINDVRILAEWGEYIFSTYSDKKNIIPLTATAIVGSSITKAARDTGHYMEIVAAVKQLYPDRDKYNWIMKFLFRGGYTHACAWWVLVVWDNVIGADYTSSYPSVMLKYDGFPKSEFLPAVIQTDGQKITDDRIRTMCVWFTAVFRGIKKRTMHTIESEHKIIAMQNAVFDNGRLDHADAVRVCLTEIDYKIYCMFYSWESIEIQEAYIAVRGMLPEYVRKPLREAYQTKARLKKWAKQNGLDPDSISEYRNAKAFINSFYGKMVQRLNFTEWIYDEVTGEWHPEESNKSYAQMLSHVILSPYWGIYVTAAARYNILSVIHKLDPEMGYNNELYADTDSCYFDDTPRNRSIIEEYNRIEMEKNKALPPEFWDIGCFEWIGKTAADGEPQHFKFKALCAKRYLKYADGEATVTVAGMVKGSYEKSLLRQFATDNSYVLYKNKREKTGKLGYIDIDELFDNFTDSYLLSCDISMKNASVYEPQSYEAEITDENGNTELMQEMCGVAIVPREFTMRLDQQYILLLHQIMEERRIPAWRE
jgi:hypothetical protein